MKASIYFNYTTRSLWRGGQRTILAIFCVAVGVMAIVALQAVGQMINEAFTGNVRNANGGDIAVNAATVPLKQSDLAFFDTLKHQGTITDYTAIMTAQGSIGLSASTRDSFSLHVVNPNTFPVVTPPTFTTPSDGSIAHLLKNNQVVVDQNFADQFHKHVGDRLDVHAKLPNQDAVTLHVKLVGIVANTGVLAQENDVMLFSLQDYQAAAPTIAPLFGTIDVVTSDQAHTDRANKEIQEKFPLVNTQTASQALKANQQQVDLIKKFLEIAGLLALLIGGVGIINTMQVLLSRRRVEIAMLKTVGYRRIDLYLLFGLEAGFLGLLGGIIGATAALGTSYLVLRLVQQLFPLNIPFSFDPLITAGGVLIGLLTALIFGLMPIVQAANIRPLNVIRELPGTNRVGSILLTIGLLLLLSVLFCLMAVVILNDVVLGVSAVYGTFAFLALLSLFFGLVVLVISILPVPERFNIGYLALVVTGVVLSALLSLVLPAFGALMLAISLMGFVIVLLPRSWKVSTKMALRNIGRQRARTTTTLLALFVGVFTIGLILVLGQNLRDQINGALANSLTYNVVTITHGNDTGNLQSHLNSIPGLTAAHTQQRTYASVLPLAIDSTPLATLLPKGNAQPGVGSLGRSGAIVFLSSVEGYHVTQKQSPDAKALTISEGRNLTAQDAGTDNALISWNLVHLDPLKGHIKVGSTISVASLDGKNIEKIHVVGVYQSSIGGNLGTILTTTDAVQTVTPAGQNTSVFYMKIDSAQVGKALDKIGKVTPDASVYNFANIGDYIDQILGDALLVLTTIASLSLLAGIIIIANAVALAMLERRRELGILKSVGYTSRTILGEVLIENGVVGGTGALLAMLLVTLATSILGQFVFKTDFGVSWYIAIGLIVGIALLAMLTATFVAWGAVRVRPLEVLRYE